MPAVINKEKCMSCGACVTVCPQSAIKLVKPDDKAEVDPEKCVSCGNCVAVCGVSAIELKS